jgi:cytochrome c553
LAGFPAVAGQQIGYLTSTLKAYRSKERNTGELSEMMQSIAQNLSDDEIDALANYMHGLYQ